MYLYNEAYIRPLFGDNLPWKKEESNEEKIDIEQIKEESYLKGEQDGYRKAKEEYEKEIAKIRKELKEKYEAEIQKLLNQHIKKLSFVIDNISTLRKEIISRAEKDIVEIALLIAKKVIKTEISHNSMIILNNIKEAIKNAVDKDQIIIRVNPEDYKILKDINGLNEILEVKEVILKEESISKGGCIVETKYSEIDSRIESQFEYIEKYIKE